MTADVAPESSPAFDAFSAHCPSRRLLDTIGDKWASLTIAALGVHGELRYSQLAPLTTWEERNTGRGRDPGRRRAATGAAAG